MAADRARIAPEGEAARPTPRDTPPGPREEVVPAAPAATASPTSLAGLAGPPRAGRGFDAARAATLLGLQQTLGNRAVQRLVQRAASSSAPATAPAAPAQEDLAARIRCAGGGQPLAPPVQGRLEAGLGADLSGVQVHADAEADRLSRAVDATAFTSGADIFFRAGAYNPGSSDGLRTLAHEATHVVQQASGPVAGTPAPGGVAISDPGDTYEQAAAQAATAVVSTPAAAPDEPAVQRRPSAAALSRGGPLPIQRIGAATQLAELGPQYDTETVTQSADLRKALTGFADFVEKLYTLKTKLAAIDASAADATAKLTQAINQLPNYPPFGGQDGLKALLKSMDLSQPATVRDRVNGIYDRQCEKARREDLIPTVFSDQGVIDAGGLNARITRYDTDPADQAKTLVTVGGGQLTRSATHAQPNQPVDTTASVTHAAGAGFEIFVVGAGGDIHMASHKLGLIHHSSLLAGASVSMAGEMKVANGTIQSMSNKTGHYQTQPEHFKHFLQELADQNVPLTFTISGFPPVPNGVTAAAWMGSLGAEETPEFEDLDTVWDSFVADFGKAECRKALLDPPPAGKGWRPTAGGGFSPEKEQPVGSGTWVPVTFLEFRQALEAKFGPAKKKLRQQSAVHNGAPSIRWQ